LKSMAFDRFDPARYAFFNFDVGMTITTNGSDFFDKRNSQAGGWYGAGLIDWTGVNDGAFQPIDGSQVIVAAIGYYFNTQLMRTADDGQNWELVTSGEENGNRNFFISFHPDDPDVVYAGNKISHDAGLTFANVDFGSFSNLLPEIVGMCQAQGDTIYAMDEYLRDYLLRSDDRGTNWYQYAHPGWRFRRLNSLPTFAVDPVDPDKIYTLSSGYDLTIFNGTSWTVTGVLALAGGAGNGNFVRGVVVDPNHPEVVYAAMTASGIPCIFRSMDGGTSWEDITYNLPRLGMAAMRINPHTGELFKGGGTGTWVFPPPPGLTYPSTNLVSSKLIAFSELDGTPPTAPSNLVAGTVASYSIDLSWDASSDDTGVEGYIIYRDGIEVGRTSGTGHLDDGLLPNAEYTHTVSAYDALENESEQSVPLATSTANGAVFTISSALSGPGTSIPASDVEVAPGGTERIMYLADIWHEIDTFTTDGLATPGAIGKTAYTKTFSSVSSDISNEVAFTASMAPVDGVTPATWYGPLGADPEQEDEDSDNLSLYVEYLLNTDPTLSAVFEITGNGIASGGLPFVMWDGLGLPHGDLNVLYSSNIVEGLWSNSLSGSMAHASGTTTWIANAPATDPAGFFKLVLNYEEPPEEVGEDFENGWTGPGTLVTDPDNPANTVLELTLDENIAIPMPTTQGIVTMRIYDRGATDGDTTSDQTDYGPRWGVAGSRTSSGVTIINKSTLNVRMGYGYSTETTRTVSWFSPLSYGGPRQVDALQVIGSGTPSNPNLPGDGRWTTWTFSVDGSGNVTITDSGTVNFRTTSGLGGLMEAWVSGGRIAYPPHTDMASIGVLVDDINFTDPY